MLQSVTFRKPVAVPLHIIMALLDQCPSDAVTRKFAIFCLVRSKCAAHGLVGTQWHDGTVGLVFVLRRQSIYPQPVARSAAFLLAS